MKISGTPQIAVDKLMEVIDKPIKASGDKQHMMSRFITMDSDQTARLRLLIWAVDMICTTDRGFKL